MPTQLLARIFPAIIVFLTCLDQPSRASEWRYEKDGFVLDYHSNGGNCVGCEWLVIDGPIPSDAGRIFQTWMKQKKFAGTPFSIYLNSPGGSLIGGMQLGRAIREFRLRTYVGQSIRLPDLPWHTSRTGRCVSACAYAFLGGLHRSTKAGEIGVHQFYQDAFFSRPLDKEFTALDLSSQQILSGLILDYIVEMGADPQIAVEASKVLPNAMKMFDEAELTRLRINFDPDNYGPWKLEEYRGGLVLSASTPDNRKQMTLLCRKTGTLELIQTYRRLEPGHHLRSTFESMKVFDVSDVLVPQATIRAVENTERSEFSLRMMVPKEALEPMFKGQRGLYFGAGPDEPRSVSGVFSEAPPRQNFPPQLRLVVRNCVR